MPRIQGDPFLADWVLRVDRYAELLAAGPYDFFVSVAPCRTVPDELLAKRFNQLIKLVNRRLYSSGYGNFGEWLTGTVAAERLSKSPFSTLHFHALVQLAVTWQARPTAEEVRRVFVTAAEGMAHKNRELPIFNAESIEIRCVDNHEPLVSYVTKELTERKEAAADLLYDLGPWGIDWLP
jgi:hypothetical protein